MRFTKGRVVCRFCDTIHMNTENCPACSQTADPVIKARRELFYALAEALGDETRPAVIHRVANAVEKVAICITHMSRKST
jgi:hypothetical protein